MKKNMVPLIGIALGIGLLVWSITSGGPIAAFIDAPSLVITLGGSFSALLVSFPLTDLKKIPNVLKQLLLQSDIKEEELIATVVDISKKTRSQGILAIENDIKELDNEMLVYGLEMVVDGSDPEDIREIMEIKAENIEKRHSVGQNIFNKWGELAPGFGMLGTLIGLIIMLGQLTDPSTIGSGMATALITTFYGSLLANMIFLPIATNLKIQTEAEMQLCEMAIEGVLSIQAGQNPRVIEQKLRSYLPASNSELDSDAVEADLTKERNYG
ncbi:motility protein A [Desemzia incerta]|uniref:Chemotaxis protein MotA n=1 Tax=Desemzia incerta TaxID=82801 RepID=A0A1I5UNK0_9LACT|nr:motility protein A [Desemzia incerta]WHZ32336.1 motility protein A [Desemzia incerta]SFP96790.1 chemotaxis protein MotA [Desemzia incerta]